jgi:hypothetical protein
VLRPSAFAVFRTLLTKSAARRKGFFSPQSWFVDLTLVSLQ